MKAYVEAGAKRVFACAVDWPGWCRSGKDEGLALDALGAYRPRYEPVAVRAGLALPARSAFEVVERLAGDATTDFGAPSACATCDREPLAAKQGQRMAALVEAAWALFEEVAARAPAELRKGPRGGGRDRDRIIDHVLSAESAYLRKIGLRFRPPDRHDAGAIAQMRRALLDVLARPSDGEPPVEKGWPIRYTARRVAWHALDHAWEMQDRS